MMQALLNKQPLRRPCCEQLLQHPFLAAEEESAAANSAAASAAVEVKASPCVSKGLQQAANTPKLAAQQSAQKPNRPELTAATATETLAPSATAHTPMHAAEHSMQKADRSERRPATLSQKPPCSAGAQNSDRHEQRPATPSQTPPRSTGAQNSDRHEQRPAAPSQTPATCEAPKQQQSTSMSHVSQGAARQDSAKEHKGRPKIETSTPSRAPAVQDRPQAVVYTLGQTDSPKNGHSSPSEDAERPSPAACHLSDTTPGSVKVTRAPHQDSERAVHQLSDTISGSRLQAGSLLPPGSAGAPKQARKTGLSIAQQAVLRCCEKQLAPGKEPEQDIQRRRQALDAEFSSGMPGQQAMPSPCQANGMARGGMVRAHLAPPQHSRHASQTGHHDARSGQGTADPSRHPGRHHEQAAAARVSPQAHGTLTAGQSPASKLQQRAGHDELPRLPGGQGSSPGAGQSPLKPLHSKASLASVAQVGAHITSTIVCSPYIFVGNAGTDANKESDQCLAVQIHADTRAQRQEASPESSGRIHGPSALPLQVPIYLPAICFCFKDSGPQHFPAWSDYANYLITAYRRVVIWCSFVPLRVVLL